MSARQAAIEYFDFHGLDARLRCSDNGYWDSSIFGVAPPVKMLESLTKHLSELAHAAAGQQLQGEAAEEKEKQEPLTAEGARESIHEIISAVVRANSSAALWRCLLQVGTQYPSTIGREILPLAWALPIFLCIDTRDAARGFLLAIWALLVPEQRARIEHTLESLEQAAIPERHKYIQKWREQLRDDLSQREEYGHSLQTAAPTTPLPIPGVVEEAPRVRKQASWSADEDPASQEAQQHDPDQPVADALSQLQKFAKQASSEVPSFAEAIAIQPVLEEVYGNLSRIGANREIASIGGEVPETLVSEAEAQIEQAGGEKRTWRDLTQSAASIAHLEQISCIEPIGTTVRRILLAASRHPEPKGGTIYSDDFDLNPSVGDYAIRAAAGVGLMQLAKHSTCADAEILEALLTLARDPARPVRYEIALQGASLAEAAHANGDVNESQAIEETLWQILETFCAQEQSCGVLQGLVQGSLGTLAGAHSTRVVAPTTQVLDRVMPPAPLATQPGAKEVRIKCTALLAVLALWKGEPAAQGFLERVAGNPERWAEEFHLMIFKIRPLLTHGRADQLDGEANAVRQRAFTFLTRLTHAIWQEIDNLRIKHPEQFFETWSQEEQDSLRALLREAELIAKELYFASGALSIKQQKQEPGKEADKPSGIDDAVRERFYHESSELSDELAKIASRPVTHHLVEMLASFDSIDERGVMLRISQVVHAAEPTGYQFESLAVQTIVELVEQYLANHPSILRNDQECLNAVLSLLDEFVQAGWPEAYHITYRLHDIFR